MITLGSQSKKRDKLSGFTLIELMIVIVIISVIASFAVLSININQNKRLETIANQLTNTLSLAQQEALIRSVTLGFAVNKNSVQFYNHQQGSAADDNPWKALSDPILGLKHFPKDIKMTLKIKDKSISGPVPQLVISASGEITPFILYIGKQGASPRYKIIGETNGSIKSEIVHAD